MENIRKAAVDMDTDTFRRTGHMLVDDIADLLKTIAQRPVTTGKSPSEMKAIIGDKSLPGQGTDAAELFQRISKIIFEHSLLNGHPKFGGYITASPAPAGMLADFLASSVNANVGANILSPVATEIERQTIKWLAEFIGVDPGYGGIITSGGNVANITAFFAARTAQAGKNYIETGLRGMQQDMLVYCSGATHTWVDKAVTLGGHGKQAIRWIDTAANRQMNLDLLRKTIEEDKKSGKFPFMVVGNAGDVSTGVVDDLAGIAEICRESGTWFHVDGAYGIPAAVLPETGNMFKGIQSADSIALDPHKWLYLPLEAGCTLIKNPLHLVSTFSSHPDYYNFDNDEGSAPINFYEYGIQNSRGFKALKVWIALQQAGKNGYINMIREDIRLARLLFELADAHEELEAVTHNLSITTLRYIPKNHTTDDSGFLSQLNETILNRIQKNGKAFFSNAIVNGHYCLRFCIVNFRTSEKDIRELIGLVVNEGREAVEQVSR